MAGISSGKRWAFGLIAIVVAILALAGRGDAQVVFPSVPLPPPGTPAGYVPVANTSGFAPWGTVGAGALTPGTAGQVPTTLNGAASVAMKTPLSVSVVDAFGAKCDGSTNDAAAFTSCLAASAANGPACYVPFSATACNITSAVTVAAGSRMVVAPGVTWSGASSSVLSRIASPDMTMMLGTSGSPVDTPLWSAQPADTTKSPFKGYLHDQTFSGTHDTVYFWGYNSDNSNTSEPVARWAIEQDYNDGSSDDKIETYLEEYGAGQVRQNRPIFTSYGRAKGDSYIQLQWENANDASVLGELDFNNFNTGIFARFDDLGAFWFNPVQQFGTSVVAPTWSQAQAANASTPQDFAVAAQIPGASCTGTAQCTPGNVDLNVGAPGASGSPGEGAMQVIRSGQGAVVACGAFPGAPTAGACWLSNSFAPAASRNATNFAIYSDSGSMILNAPTQLLSRIGNTSYAKLTAGDFSSIGTGGTTLGAQVPFGTTYIGASASGGYTVIGAVTGVINTQHAIVNDSRFGLRTTSASFGPFNAQTYTITAHHGITLDCEATGRVVTSGVGGTFWTAAADNTYGCRVVVTAAYTGAAGLANSLTYPHCDCSGGACTSPSSPTNPLLVFAASINTGTGVAQITWSTFSDGSTTKPVVDIISHCIFTDD